MTSEQARSSNLRMLEVYHGPLVPTAVMRDVLKRYWRDGGTRALSIRSDVPERRIQGIMRLESRWVAFSVADKLITRGLRDPSLWYREPELKKVYESPHVGSSVRA